MEGLWIAMATCLLVSCSVKGVLIMCRGIMKDLERTRPADFQCPDMSPSPSVPSSVEFVKAADIKVIAALGDSVTTALGANATSLPELAIEYRHVSWSIGGYGTFQDVITLPNILKLFNPRVLGASPGKTVYGMSAHINDTGFNLAVTGENTFNLPRQTRDLIDTLRGYEGLNFKEDWKLLTILIGMNDICNYCKDKSLFSADNFIHHITVSLDMLMNEVPRMIVNVVQIMPMQTLREVEKLNPGCLIKRSLCVCLIEPQSNSPELKELVEINLEYQKRLEQLMYTDRFFKKDFAVVLQPFMKDSDIPRLPNGKVDMTFFSNDCFHFTMKGHKELAKALWNNMFQPVGGKTLVRNFAHPISLICPPVEHPYIYTRPIVAQYAKRQSFSRASSHANTLLLLLHMAVAYFLFL